jgi:hypothetical protein
MAYNRHVVSIATDWPHKPEDEPPVPKPDLRDFFGLGKPPESALGKPLWSSTLPHPAPVWPAEYPALTARKAFRLARALRDSRMLLASLRWYDAHLIPGQNTILKPARREKSRKLNPYWRYYLQAARRVCGVVYRQHLLHEDKYRIRHPVWTQLQLRFGFDYDRRMAFLWDPVTEYRFKAVPADFRITTDQMIKLDVQIGAQLLEKAQEYLLRDIDPAIQEIFAREEAERQARCPGYQEEVSRRPNNPPAAPNEITVQQFAKNFLAKLRCR